MTGLTRIHSGAGEPVTRAGGMHNYLLTLALGQLEIGLDPYVLDDLRSRREWRIQRVEVTGLSSVEAATKKGLHDIAERSRFHFHFAQGSDRLLRGPLKHRDLNEDILHFHGPWGLEGKVQGNSLLRSKLKHLLERRIYRKFGRFVTASEAFREVLTSDFGIHKSQTRVVYPGVDQRRFKPGAQLVARERLSLPKDQFIIGCVRRLEPRMGIGYAIAALREVPGAHLLIVGTGSLRADLEAQVSDLGLADRVRFLGRVSDGLLPDVYRAVNVTIVPTVALEGFGLIVREAISCGSPVISTNVGGLPEAMGSFATKWTVAPRNAEDLAGKLMEVVEGRGPSAEELRNEARGFGAAAMATALEAAW